MPSDHSKTTVLVVEDEVLVRMHGMDLLEDAGFTVLEAGNADEALAILSQHDEVQVLFSDVDMPGMDGLELARQVHMRWPNIRLLLTSGQHLINESTMPDHDRFVSKPWTQDMLVQKIRDMLSA